MFTVTIAIATETVEQSFELPAFIWLPQSQLIATIDDWDKTEVHFSDCCFSDCSDHIETSLHLHWVIQFILTDQFFLRVEERKVKYRKHALDQQKRKESWLAINITIATVIYFTGHNNLQQAVTIIISIIWLALRVGDMN